MARATTNFGSLICDALDLYFPSSVCVLTANLHIIPVLHFCKSDPRCLKLRTQKMRTHQLVATHGKPLLCGLFISRRNL